MLSKVPQVTCSQSSESGGSLIGQEGQHLESLVQHSQTVEGCSLSKATINSTQIYNKNRSHQTHPWLNLPRKSELAQKSVSPATQPLLPSGGTEEGTLKKSYFLFVYLYIYMFIHTPTVISYLYTVYVCLYTHLQLFPLYRSVTQPWI